MVATRALEPDSGHGFIIRENVHGQLKGGLICLFRPVN